MNLELKESRERLIIGVHLPSVEYRLAEVRPEGLHRDRNLLVSRRQGLKHKREDERIRSISLRNR